MPLNQLQLNELGVCAIQAATQAGELIKVHSREKLVVHQKEGGDSLASQVFTEVDLASEQIILKALRPSIEKYDLALLSEETADDGSRFEKDYFWCIDPLDGTLPFIEQTDGYAVSIALVDKLGIPHIGVIYNPVDSTLYHAIKGQGAFKNKKTWLLNSEQKSFSFICDRSFSKQPKGQAAVEKLKKHFGEHIQIIAHGGAAMNAIWVLENSPSIYLKFQKIEDGGGSLWDYAASACIFNEIGAYAASFNKEELDLNRTDSSFMNHKGICYCSAQFLAKEIQLILL
jgi:fructose-1,6-bisphosphatase/inositol monophosphatase family enzyme